MVPDGAPCSVYALKYTLGNIVNGGIVLPNALQQLVTSNLSSFLGCYSCYLLWTFTCYYLVGCLNCSYCGFITVIYSLRCEVVLLVNLLQIVHKFVFGELVKSSWFAQAYCFWNRDDVCDVMWCCSGNCTDSCHWCSVILSQCISHNVHRRRSCQLNIKGKLGVWQIKEERLEQQET